MSYYDYDYIIIGGGISGLVTAYKLSQIDKYNILLIESTNRLGGRLYTLTKGDVSLEMGAGRISSKHTKLITLLKELFNLNESELFKEELIQLPTDIKYKLELVPNINFYSLISELIDKSGELSTKVKQSINLFQLCIDTLGYKSTQVLKAKLGYDSEFELMNAHHALKTFKKDLFSKCDYYVLKRGFSHIVDLLHQALESKQVTILLDTQVKNVTNHRIKIHRKEYTGDKIICCIPQKALLALPKFKEYKELDSVNPVPLLRIYAKYPMGSNKKVWFHNLKRTITDNYIRHIIPIDYEKGTIMISYIDGHYAEMWRDLTKLGNKELVKRLHKEIKELFGIRPPNPEFIEYYYWSEGCHMWKPGLNVEKVYKQILQPFPKEKIYIVNESFSKHQSWVEGCLDMSYDVLQMVDNGFKPTVHGGAKRKQSVKKYTIKQVLKHSTWIVLDINKKKRIYDVSRWFKSHPGGRDNLKKGIKANKHYLYPKKYPESPIDLFKQIGAHKSGNVIQKILNNKIEFIVFKGYLK
jgi:protoporphyrinogen oxidase